MLNRYYVNESHLPMKYFHLSHSKIIKLLNTAIRHADGYQVRTRDPQKLWIAWELNEMRRYVKLKPSHDGC